MNRKATVGLEKLVASSPENADYLGFLAVGHANRGGLLEALNRLEEASGEHNKAIKILKDLAAHYPDQITYRVNLATSLTNLGTVEFKRDRYVPAAEACRESVEILEGLSLQNPNVPDYIARMVESRLGLALVLRGMKRRSEAEDLLRVAIHSCERLVSVYPKIPQYARLHSQCLHDLGETLYDQGRLEDAVRTLRDAIARQRPMVESAPKITKDRELLDGDYKALANALCALGDTAGAAEAARERASLSPRDPEQLFDIACGFARIVSIESDPARKTSVADEAMRMLRAAMSAGWSNAAQTARHADLASLAGREDFQHLVGLMFDRIFPAKPFSD